MHRKTVKKTLLIILIAALSLSASITVTKSSSKTLSFTFTLDDYSITSFTRNDSVFSRISSSGTNTKLVDEHDVSIPCLSLHSGVPASGNTEIKFASHEVKRIKLDNPLEVINKDEGDPAEYTSPPFNNPWISTIKYVRFRNLKTGHFFIRPFIYEPKTSTLLVLIKGSCTLTFPSVPYRTVPKREYEGDYYAMVKNLVLNFDIAKNWISSVQQVIQPPAVRILRQPNLPSNDPMVTFTIGDGHGSYNEATTEENRIVKIKASQIATSLGNSIDVNRLVLYGSIKERLDSVVPFPNELPPGVVEIPIRCIDLNADGKFAGSDYLLAYVTGTCDWYYDTALHNYEYTFNHYEDYRTYWLSAKGKNTKVRKFIPPKKKADTTLTVFENRIRYKKSKELTYNGYRKPYGGIDWIWVRLTDKLPNFSFLFDLSDINMSYPGNLRIGHGSIDGIYNTQATFAGTILSDTATWKPITNWGNRVLNIDLEINHNLFELAHLDLRYYQNIDMGGKKKLRIYSPLDSGKIFSYHLSNIPAERIVIFRIPANEAEISVMIDTTFSGASNTYTWTDTGGIGIQYFISTESGFDSTLELITYTPGNNGIDELQRPKYGTIHADYLIITHRDFKDEAIRLAEHKRTSSSIIKNPKVIDIDHIFRDFSGGNHDPGAIRNFLFYALNSSNWITKPDYVLLMGNGHYDYKGYKTNIVNFIPTIQMKIGSFFKCVEDFFACLNPGETVADYAVSPDLFLGRITCATVVEAANAVEKIIDTESGTADYSAWRNRILLISDDDMQGNGPDYIGHYVGNEDIEDIVHKNRPSMEVRKVYLFDYEWNDLYQKPEASMALFNEVNKGVSVVNYFGHGSEEAWADEYILTKDMVGNFSNYKKYPLILSFSCSVGRFDNLGKPCLSGLFVTAPRCGAIGALSSARSAFASINTEMARNFFKILYEKDTLRPIREKAKHRNWTFAQAYTFTKAIENVNLKHYVYIGDPSIRHIEITDSVELEVTGADGSTLEDTVWMRIVDTDTIYDTLQRMKSLQRISVTGQFVRNNILNSTYGTASDPDSIQIGLYNPDQDSVKRKDGGTFTNPIYSRPGTPLFIGITQVINGRFKQEIFLPRKVPFGKYGVSFKAYGWDGKQFGTGFKNDIIIIGTDTVDLDDIEGPRISVRPIYDTIPWNTNAGFTDRLCSTLPFGLEIQLWDKSGIDRTGIGPEEGLTIEIPGVKERQNLNDKFTFSEGKYTQGAASYYLQSGDINPGNYDMVISAQDMLGNISELTVGLDILDPDDFDLHHTFNYPNPVRMNGTTKFYFYHTNKSQEWHGGVEAKIKIYTLSGKLIRVFKSAKNGETWDLTDQRGHVLTPNVYLYRVTVKMLNSGFSDNEKIVKSPIKKLVILPPG